MEKIRCTDRVRSEEVLDEEPRKRGISSIKYKKERLTGLATSLVGTAF
jgi:hypothetical protein